MATFISETSDVPSWAQAVAPDVFGLRVFIANLFFVGEPGAGAHWTLIDAGLFNCAARIKSAAQELYGIGATPQAIVMTHGHFDHTGALAQLSQEWDVPVYAHPLEFPFLRGEADYPAPDPNVGGGAMAALSPLYPRHGCDLRTRLLPLPESGEVPTMPGWKWIHTPGHAPGHVSLWRASDKVLLAGDAFVTTEQESALSVLTQKRVVHRPPAYYTVNWKEARDSVRKLAALEPEVVATGHGQPMRGAAMRAELQTLARDFDQSAVPQGRFYADYPAHFDIQGHLTSPAPPDPLPPLLLKAGAISVGALLLRQLAKRS